MYILYIFILCIFYIYIIFCIYIYIICLYISIYIYNILYILYYIYIYPGLYYFGFILDVFLVIEFWFMFIFPGKSARCFWPRIRWKLSYQLVGLFFHLNFREYPNIWPKIWYIYIYISILGSCWPFKRSQKPQWSNPHKISAKCW